MERALMYGIARGILRTLGLFFREWRGDEHRGEQEGTPAKEIQWPS
jgi:hypothetical protein